jgi:hypothetical protein
MRIRVMIVLVAILIALAGWSVIKPLPVVLAQAQAPAADSPPTPPLPELPLSRDCKTPGLEMKGNTPLPNVARALKERKVVRILAIGGSSSGGLQSGRGGYQRDIEAALEKLIPGLDVVIIDRGVSGELAAASGQRMQAEIAINAPDLVLWQVGTSDALAQIPPDEFVQSVSTSLDWLKAHNIDVVLVGLHYIRALRTDPGYQALRVALNKLAESQGVMRIGRYEATQSLDQTLGRAGDATGNQFAATEAGYSCLAEYVTRAVTAGIFVKRGVTEPATPPK